MRSERGAALIVILALLGLAVLLFASGALDRTALTRQEQSDAEALARAKDALIGYAASYRSRTSTSNDDVNGFLPLPDLGRTLSLSEGTPSATTYVTDRSLLGKLPWRTLGLPARPSAGGECLWYALSGRFKNAPQTASLNWDTAGQFDVSNDSGSANTLSNAAAVLFAPGAVIDNQNRAADASSFPGAACEGNYNALNYLDPFAAGSTIAGITNYFGGTANSALGPVPPATAANKRVIAPGNSATYNDRMIAVTVDEIYDRIANSSEFATDLNGVLDDLTTWMNSLATLPASGTAASKGFSTVYTQCNGDPACYGGTPSAGSTRMIRKKFLQHWQDNFLYIKLPSPVSINVGGTVQNNCQAVLLFGGRKSGTQTRSTAATKALALNYLENTAPYTNLNSFNSGGASSNYGGGLNFDRSRQNQDLLRCITGASGPSGPYAVKFSDPAEFAKFAAAGSGVSTTANTVTLATAPGSSGGCFFYNTALPLDGMTLRLFFGFQFSTADPAAPPDRGNGFTVIFHRGDIPNPGCGTSNDMGTTFDLPNFFIETDVYRNAANNDPAANHFAIMRGGNLTHSALPGGNGYTTNACNGSAHGCFLPATPTRWEESPAPLPANQRIEIQTRCTPGCAACNVAGNTSVRIAAWSNVAAAGFSDTTTAYPGAVQALRCIDLGAASPLNTFRFGITGGFRSGAGSQGVTIRNLDLRVE